MKTEQITCPVCGKTHAVAIHYKPQGLYLDLVPIEPVTNKLNAYIICDCGMLCYNNAQSVYKPVEMIADTAYQAVLARTDINIDEKKMLLMQTGFFDYTVPLMMAHYYHASNQEKRKQCLETALTMLMTGKDKANKQLSGDAMPAMKVKKNALMAHWFYTAQHKQIDILRQLGRFTEAKQLLHELSFNHKVLPAEQHFFDIEEKLIQREITEPK